MAKSNADRELKIKTLIDRGYTGNPETGIIYNSRKKISRSKDGNGYSLASTYLNGKYISIRASYFIWYLKYNEVAQKLAHINGDITDNRISNLQEIKLKKDKEINYSTEIDIGNEKLLKQIKFNLNRVPGFNRILDKHIKNTIINEAYIKVISMIGNGSISNVFEKVKGYIFILCKNEVYLTINPKKTDIKINRNYEDLSTLDICQKDYHHEDEVFFNTVLEHLLEKNYRWYQIIKLKLEKKSNKEIQEEIGCELWNINIEKRKVYKYIRDNVDKFR
jgi:hypothetical protein